MSKSETPNPKSAYTVVTPQGEGGISVVQVWGSEAARQIDSLFVSPSGRLLSATPSGTLVYGTLQRHGEILDEVIVCRRSRPFDLAQGGAELARPPCGGHGRMRGIAGELFEINCHGGMVPLMRVIAALKSQGIEQAESSSALGYVYRGCRIDKVRREAAEALPAAMTPVAAKMLLDQASGVLSAALEDVASALRDQPSAALPRAREDLAALLRTAELGLRLCSPPRIVIAGRPNVGKSTLFNRLLREERTLVDPTPGTTRDSIDHGVSIKHYPFILVDTAGIAASPDELGRLSGLKSREEIHGGDIVLLLIDRSRPFSDEDREIIDSVLGYGSRNRARIIPILTKGDLPKVMDQSQVEGLFERTPIVISVPSRAYDAGRGTGMDELEECLVSAAFPLRWRRGMPVVFTDRQ